MHFLYINIIAGKLVKLLNANYLPILDFQFPIVTSSMIDDSLVSYIPFFINFIYVSNITVLTRVLSSKLNGSGDSRYLSLVYNLE